MALGTPGGDQQEQWQVPVLLRMIVGGYTAQQAIDAPSLHTTALVDSFWPRGWTAGGRGRRGPPRRRGDRRPRAARTRRASAPATGRSDASRPSAAMPRPAASGPPPTPAACRATPPVADRGHRRAQARARRNSATSGASPAPTSSAGRLRPFTSNECPPPSIHAIRRILARRDGLLELRVRIDERVVRALDEQLRLRAPPAGARRAPSTGRPADAAGSRGRRGRPGSIAPSAAAIDAIRPP